MTDQPTAPTGPTLLVTVPPHVAAGELIESSWGNSVTDAITELALHDAQRVVNGVATPTGELLTAGDTTPSNWWAVTVPAPAWARTMVVDWTIQGAYQKGSGLFDFLVAPIVGGVSATAGVMRAPGDMARIPLLAGSFNWSIPGGAVSMTMRGARVAGTAVLGADGGSVLAYTAHFTP